MNFTINIGEMMHIIWVKDLFKWTNKRNGYKKEISDYNIQKFNLMIKDDIDIFFFTKILI